MSVRRITLNGESLTITQWANRVGINRDIINQRLSKGWTEFDAVFAKSTHNRFFAPRAETVEVNKGYTMLDYVVKRNEGTATIQELTDYFSISIEQCRRIYDRVFNVELEDIGRMI